jgi:hypothetical protein
MPVHYLTHEFSPFRGGISLYVEEMARASAACGAETTVWAVGFPKKMSFLLDRLLLLSCIPCFGVVHRELRWYKVVQTVTKCNREELTCPGSAQSP